MVTIKHTHHYYRFCVCVVFAIILGGVTGCHTNNSPLVSFQKQIDSHHSPYQFSEKSFIPTDIQALKNNNLDLKTAQIRIEQSQALYKQAYAGYLPQVTASFSGNRQINNQRGGQNAFVMRPQGNLTFYSLDSQASFVPDFFGKTKLRTLIADNQIQADYLQAQAHYLQILNGYVKNYNLVCSTKSLLHIHENMVKLNQNISDSVKIRYELGRATSVDYYNARDTLYASRNDYDKAQQNHNLALQSYYSLIGKSVIDSNNKPLCPDGFVPLPQQTLTIHLQDLDNRPDIQAIQYHLKTAYYNRDLTLKAIYPDISVLFTVQSFSDTLSNILDVNRFINNFVGQISQVIYDGGLRDINIELSESEVKLLKETYYDTVLSAGNDLITLGKNFSLAMTLEHQAQTRLENANKALDAANRNYKLGNINFIDLLNSQRNAYNAQTEYVFMQHNMRNLYGDILTNSGIAPIGFKPE